jgi:lactoylglutathione lyase
MDQPNLKLAVPFFMVTDMEKSLDFYCNGLGFTLANQWTPRGKIEWCWLTRDLISLMLQEPRGNEHVIHANPQHKGLGITICTQCTDALALYSEFKSRNLLLTEPFVGNNRWVFSVKDPDGYRLEFQSATDTPEGTTYLEWSRNSPNNTP